MHFQIRIEVKSVDTCVHQDEKGNLICTQAAWAHLGEDYPERVYVPVESGREPYPPGFYNVDPKSCYVNVRRELAIRTLRLLPIK